MTFVHGALAAAILAALALATTASVGATRSPSVASSHLLTDLRPIPTGVAVRPLAPGTPLSLTITLASRDPAGLAALDRAVVEASDPQYRHFLSAAEVQQRFSPTAAATTAVESYFETHGGSAFSRTPDGFGVTFRIPAAGAAAALSTNFDSWGRGASLQFSAASAPVLPATLTGLVTGISGLADPGPASRSETMSHPVATGALSRAHSTNEFVADSTSGSEWFYGSDMTQAYGVSDLFPTARPSGGSFGTGEAVATILMSGYNDSTHLDEPPFDPSAVAQYYNDTFPANWPHPRLIGVPVTVGGVTPPGPGPYGGLNDTSLNEAENSLDLEMAGSMAPGATLVNFYFAASLYLGPNASGANGVVADEFARCLSTALSHNYSPARLAAVTNSFGLPDLNDSLWNTELQVAAAMGVTVVAASGDQGNAPQDLTNRFQGQWPTWPASAAFESFGTIAIGGTSVDLGGQPVGIYSGSVLPTGFDANLSGSTSQSAWYDSLGGVGNLTGTEGGVSTLYPEPSWQFHSAAQPAVSNATGAQGAGQLGRSEPDVAFLGNTTVAYTGANSTDVFFDVLEGTSIASPLFAGIIAVWSGVANHTFGYLDPELYRIGSYYAAHPGPLDPFLDVTQGNNFVFSALPGWDATTGWGGMNASRFLAADGDKNVSNFVYTGPTPGVPPPLLNFPTNRPVTVPVLIVVTGVVVATIVAIVLVFGRSRSTVGVVQPVPPGAAYPGPGYPPPPPGAPGTYPMPAMFSCPYCGTSRPAEPVRCPGCGAL